MIEELLKSIASTSERQAVAMERMAAAQEAMLAGAGVPQTVPAEAAPKTGKGKATKSEPAKFQKTEETPAPAEPAVDVEEECKQLREVNNVAFKKDKVKAKAIFTEYQAETGIEKIADMSSDQRTELKGRLQAFIDGGAEEEDAGM